MGMFLRRGEPPRVTLKITFSRSYCSVTVDGKTYTSSTTLDVVYGTPVTMRATWYAATSASAWQRDCQITVDGVTVATGWEDGVGDRDRGYLLYTMPATTDMTLVAGGSKGGDSYNGTWTVTTA